MTDTPNEKQADLLVTDPSAAPLAVVATNPLMAMIDKAIAAKIGAEELNRLLDAADRVDKKLAKQAFSDALAAFQDECPPIPKSSTAKIVTQKGTYTYDYPALEDCERIALPFLLKHGFARRYGSVRTEGTKLTASCVLEHRGGHDDETFYELDIETRAGMSAAQKGGAAETYAKRRAFINAAGLRIVGEDNDGGDNGEPGETITEDQQHTIQDLIIQSQANRVALLEYFEVKQLGEIPTNRFEEACRMLNEKIARQATA